MTRQRIAEVVLEGKDRFVDADRHRPVAGLRRRDRGQRVLAGRERPRLARGLFRDGRHRDRAQEAPERRALRDPRGRRAARRVPAGADRGHRHARGLGHRTSPSRRSAAASSCRRPSTARSTRWSRPGRRPSTTGTRSTRRRPVPRPAPRPSTPRARSSRPARTAAPTSWRSKSPLDRSDLSGMLRGRRTSDAKRAPTGDFPDAHRRSSRRRRPTPQGADDRPAGPSIRRRDLGGPPDHGVPDLERLARRARAPVDRRQRRVRPALLDLRRDLAPDRQGREARTRPSPSTSTRRASPRSSAASR